MDVFEAYPKTLLGGLPELLKCFVVLASSHRHLEEVVSAYDFVSGFFELLGGVGAWRDNEEDGNVGGRVVFKELL